MGLLGGLVRPAVVGVGKAHRQPLVGKPLLAKVSGAITPKTIGSCSASAG
jgi:hypothetical protein